MNLPNFYPKSNFHSVSQKYVGKINNEYNNYLFRKNIKTLGTLRFIDEIITYSGGIGKMNLVLFKGNCFLVLDMLKWK